MAPLVTRIAHSRILYTLNIDFDSCLVETDPAGMASLRDDLHCASVDTQGLSK